ncbi:MAG: cold shock domain-containing protein [Cellvibrionaceae bacterium]
MPNLSTGIVKWFDDSKGFGFIACEDGTDLIAYRTSINGPEFKALQGGQRVTFAISESNKGSQAISISATP